MLGFRRGNRVTSIGLAEADFPFASHVGDTATSIGYRSTGEVRHKKKTRDYFPKYRKGDVIGCGVSFIAHRVFFTKNKNLIGSVKLPKNFKNYFYTAALSGPQASVIFNFGKTPFQFDLKSHIEEETTASINEIIAQEVDHQSLSSIVASHLFKEGFKETFDSLVKSAELPKSQLLLIPKDFFSTKERNSSQKTPQPLPQTQDSLNAGQPEERKHEEAENDASNNSPSSLTGIRSFVRNMLSRGFSQLFHNTHPNEERLSDFDFFRRRIRRRDIDFISSDRWFTRGQIERQGSPDHEEENQDWINPGMLRPRMRYLLEGSFGSFEFDESFSSGNTREEFVSRSNSNENSKYPFCFGTSDISFLNHKKIEMGFSPMEKTQDFKKLPMLERISSKFWIYWPISKGNSPKPTLFGLEGAEIIKEISQCGPETREIQLISENFPCFFKENKETKNALTILKFVKLLQAKEFLQAVLFAQEHLVPIQDQIIPCLENSKSLSDRPIKVRSQVS